MSWGLVDGQLQRLEVQQARQTGNVQNRDAYQFLARPTCPPSTSITFIGGQVWWPSSALFPYCYYIPGYTVDLTDTTKVSIKIGIVSPMYSYTFTNAYWYVPAMIVLASYGLSYHEEWPDEIPDMSIWLTGTLVEVDPYMEEFETAGEAESRMGANKQLDTSRQHGLVVASVILRNNGDTVSPNAWMEIDPVNRGRSYFFRSCVPAWEAQ